MIRVHVAYLDARSQGFEVECESVSIYEDRVEYRDKTGAGVYMMFDRPYVVNITEVKDTNNAKTTEDKAAIETSHPKQEVYHATGEERSSER